MGGFAYREKNGGARFFVKQSRITGIIPGEVARD